MGFTAPVPEPAGSPDPVDPRTVLRHRLEVEGFDLVHTDPDPFLQIRRWWDEVAAAGVLEPSAMALATATPDGRPSVRFVLLRGLDEKGFVFFTNERSRKGQEIAANRHASAVLAWHDVGRQVRADGRVEDISDAESDAYFDSRPRGSQLSAWASPQSEVVADRAALDRRRVAEEIRWADRPVQRPPYWHGFRLVPAEIELWQQRGNRYHDRLRYRRGEPGPDSPAWIIERLAP